MSFSDDDNQFITLSKYENSDSDEQCQDNVMCFDLGLPLKSPETVKGSILFPVLIMKLILV